MLRISMLLGAAGLVFAQPVSAAVANFTFTGADSSAGLGAGPYGTVSVTENNNGLDFVFTLLNGYRIHDGNANHNAFAFRLTGDPAVTITGLTAGFAAIATGAGDTVSAPPYGNYLTGIDCTVCGAGYAGGYAGTLSFRVTAASALSLASLGSNTVSNTAYFFTSDVVNSAGATGNVGATRNVTGAIPEPATWAMMLLGFGGMGYAVRRRRPRFSSRIRFA